MRHLLTVSLALAFAASHASAAELSAEQLARIAQNPLANVISVPFQYNANFDVGPLKRRQDILNIQPVVPFALNDDWNVITRTIIPVIRQPEFFPGQGERSGVGDMQFSAFLAPGKPGPDGVIWGAGAVVQMPTDSHGLGNKNWGLGPTLAVLKMLPGDPWVYGLLLNNVTSLTRSERGGRFNNFLLQPILSYNLPGGTYINSVPLITANWEASSGQQWTVPVGMGVGHIFHLGPAPVNTQFGTYYNAVRPDNAARWQLRTQVQFMFPK